MTTRKHKKPHGVLYIVSLMLVVSAVLRVVIGANEAIAGGHDVPAVDVVAASPAEDISAAFLARQKRLDEREAQIADRMQALSVAEGEFSEKLDALTRAEEKLSATIALAEVASESDLNRLTLVYENMAPKDAAALFEQMPPMFAAGFLGLMEPAAAAKVFAGLKPETAYSFSVVLAGRNALVPTQ